MTYFWLNATVLLTLFVVLNVVMRKTPWRSIGLTAIVLMSMTAVFDNLIIASGIVGYDPNKILGWMVGLAPIEDFAYTLAAVVLVPALWKIFSREKK
jgi:lycopene cyclase domain-containing protein